LLSSGIPEFSVFAGPRGLTCTYFDGDVALKTLRLLDEDTLRQAANSAKALATNPRRSAAVPINRKRCEVKLNELKEICILGTGGFAEVLLVEDPQENQYALKRMSKGHLIKSGAAQQVTWEKELLTMVDSVFVIALHRAMMDEQNVYFLLEPLFGGSLYQFYNHHPDLFQDDDPRGFTIAFYVACITLGLEHMHERSIVYRDLKPENVLLDTKGYGKMCDMGFARFVLGRTNTMAGTPEYMAPEMIDFPHEHGLPVDWWSLGVVIYELMCFQTPFDDEGYDGIDRCLAIRRSQERSNYERDIPPGAPKKVKELCSALLQKSESRRLGTTGGAKEIKDHELFKQMREHIDWKLLMQKQVRSPFVPPEFDPSKVDYVPEDSEGLSSPYVPDGTRWDFDDC
jgi:serine/threonine protein kinase